MVSTEVKHTDPAFFSIRIETTGYYFPLTPIEGDRFLPRKGIWDPNESPEYKFYDTKSEGSALLNVISDKSGIWLLSSLTESMKSLDDFRIFRSKIEDWVLECQMLWCVYNSSYTRWLSFLQFPLCFTGCNEKPVLFQYREYNSLAESQPGSSNSDFSLGLLEKLLTWKFSPSFFRVLQRYCTAFESPHPLVRFFFIFSALDGLITQWAESEGRSYLFDTAFATPALQDSIQDGMRTCLIEFKKRLTGLDETQKRELDAFIDSNFPPVQDGRKHRRSLKNRVRDYIKYHLKQDWSNYKDFFDQILKLRDASAHGGAIAVDLPIAVEDINKLIKITRDFIIFEVNDIIKSTIKNDWRTRPRDPDLKTLLQKIDFNRCNRFIESIQKDVNFSSTDYEIFIRRMYKTEFRIFQIEKMSYYIKIQLPSGSDFISVETNTQIQLKTSMGSYSNEILQNQPPGTVIEYKAPQIFFKTRQGKEKTGILIPIERERNSIFPQESDGTLIHMFSGIREYIEVNTILNSHWSDFLQTLVEESILQYRLST